MEERGQFTFYRSYYEALKSLPKKEREPVLMAIIAYALDGEITELTGIGSAIFSLVKPTLDTGRKKAESGKQGGSKPKANAKQTATEKEKEKEVEGEEEKEKEDDSPTPPTPQGFGEFWQAYPKKVGKQSALKSFANAMKTTDLQTILAAIERQKRSRQWNRDGGQYIPYPATWLNQERWEDELGGVKDAGAVASGDPSKSWSLRADID